MPPRRSLYGPMHGMGGYVLGAQQMGAAMRPSASDHHPDAVERQGLPPLLWPPRCRCAHSASRRGTTKPWILAPQRGHFMKCSEESRRERSLP